MAFIIPEITKSAGDTRSALSRVSWDRQRDCYLNALRGVASCRRLWEEYAREEPAMARLVVTDVEMDRARDVAANRHLDQVLTKADKKKPKKAKKPEKGTEPQISKGDSSGETWLRSLLASPDPATREWGRKELNLP